ncbi:3-isopropylmalate dehydratase small subunit [Commensalibacter oyaizuii]|uniref:3-isopropylmalate dehydratase small subunit n=1 Tax=Commensalibacter oyaizuii TaxID=3043873 RepID=A0ABT6PZY5_9PROT|nr:3-isopropylmalate dehydratase small subunit [Commensalibacter sp. TBRC 16381]MDI2090426.1 3-isopropylmalate dehydratase small subunit [Commensalibacter sp. TBRC 16381]
MEKFEILTAIAAPLPEENIDTDKIIPARFLKTTKRSGLGKFAFHAWRYDENDQERPEFVLNREPYRNAEILITYENFGCGSSREHAPWALLDFGIRCVIAPSFADIFFNNSFKNGILPIKLPREICEQLVEDTKMGANAKLTINLEKQEIVRPNGERIAFEVDPLRRQLLLDGMDDIAQTLQHVNAIEKFENKRKQEQSWFPKISINGLSS